jgi:hypothetical protein
MNDEYDNNLEFFEELAKLYPELLERSQIGDSFGVGAGWNNIINTLCCTIYSNLHNAKNQLRGASEYPRSDNGEWLAASQANYEKELEELPVIVQVKEKYGTLRFYVHNSTDRVEDLIGFAERMSGCTCEVCGKPGRTGGNGWIRTLCIDHREPEPSEILEGTVSPNLFDE